MAVVPVHNTVIGNIKNSDKTITLIDLASSMGLRTIHKLDLRIEHKLASYGRFDQLRMAYSKYEVFEQCSIFLKKHNLEMLVSTPTDVEITDSATAAWYVSKADVPYAAAICSKEAAEYYGIPIVRGNIANFRKNHTKFHAYAMA